MILHDAPRQQDPVDCQLLRGFVQPEELASEGFSLWEIRDQGRGFDRNLAAAQLEERRQRWQQH